MIGQAMTNRDTSRGVSSTNYDLARGEVQQMSTGTNSTTTSEAYSNAMRQDTVVGTLDLPPTDLGGDDYEDWV
jgi:hypothetical protein